MLDSGNPRQVKAEYQQSTFLGAPISLETLRKRAAQHVLVLNEEARIDQTILRLIDGNTTLEKIARRLTEEFPARFDDWKDALARVGDLSIKYSQ